MQQLERDVILRVEVNPEIMAGSATTSRWHRVLGSVASSQLLMWAALIVLFSAVPLLLLKSGNILDPDIWWHMRAGEWILQHHRVLRVDPFSAPTMGHPWVDYSWLFEFGLNLLVTHFDLASILWFQIAIYAVVTAVMLKFISSLMPRFWPAVGLTALAIAAMLRDFGPQPQAFTILFFILEFYLLLRAERTGRFKSLWTIPFLFVLWSNIHIEFVSGLFLLGVFCIEPGFERLFRGPSDDPFARRIPNRRLWLLLGTSMLGSFANPYGIGLYRTVFHYAHDTKVYDVIIELKAMSFRDLNCWFVLLLLMLGCFFLGRSRRARPVWVLLLAWAAWMSFRSIKEAWLVPVVAAALIASRHEWGTPTKMKLGWQMRFATAIGAFLIWLAGAGYWHVNAHTLLRNVNSSYPVGAVSYIHQHHLQGPILNDFNWGGFLIYALPEIPVSMDGRTNVHSQDDVVQGIQLYSGEPGWRSSPQLARAKLILCSYAHPLAALLARDPHFRVVYNDPVSVLFQVVEATKDGGRR